MPDKEPSLFLSSSRRIRRLPISDDRDMIKMFVVVLCALSWARPPELARPVSAM